MAQILSVLKLLSELLSLLSHQLAGIHSGPASNSLIQQASWSSKKTHIDPGTSQFRLVLRHFQSLPLLCTSESLPISKGSVLLEPFLKSNPNSTRWKERLWNSTIFVYKKRTTNRTIALFFLTVYYFNCVNMYGFCVCVSVCSFCLWLIWCWKLNLSPLPEQYSLLTTEASLQSPTCSILNHNFWVPRKQWHASMSDPSSIYIHVNEPLQIKPK